jgi:hypothetical protein
MPLENDNATTKAARKAALEFMNREGFVRRGPWGFTDDVCSEDVPYPEGTAAACTIIADRLEDLARAYREAARSFAETEIPDERCGL